MPVRDKFRTLLASVTSPLESSPWSRLHPVTPVQAVTKRAVFRLVRSGDAHKRCAFADLYEAQYTISMDIFELLDAEHTQLSVVRRELHSKDMFMNAWRYKRDAKAFHKTVQERVNGCAMLASRALRVTGSVQDRTPPAIKVVPASPSIHATYISCDASASDADDSSYLHTPTESDFTHEFSLGDRKLVEECYPTTSVRHSREFSPSLDVIVEKPSPEIVHQDFHIQDMPPPDIEEEHGEDSVAIEIISSPTTPQQEPCSAADVPRSPSGDELECGDNSPSSSSGDELTAELMTAEIMVGTPATSGPASCIETKPDMCLGIDYENPAEYIDMYLHGYGIDPQPYWLVTGSLSRATLQPIADIFKNDGLIAGMDMLDCLVRQNAVSFIQERTPREVESAICYTTDLVSPSDSLVTSPRPALAGAVGEIVCKPNTEILEPQAMYDDQLPGDPDCVSVVGEPYGPSRSTTVDDQLVGEAPQAHLGDQLAFMMQHLPSPTSPMTFATPANDKRSRSTPEEMVSGANHEMPRLWSIRGRTSPQPTFIDLPTTPTSDETPLPLSPLDITCRPRELGALGSRTWPPP